MEYLQGYRPNVERSQPPTKKGDENKTKPPLEEIRSLTQRVRPITDVFDADKEFRKLRSVPKKQRAEALSTFKDKLIRQSEAWALCRTTIEERIDSNPDLSRKELIAIVKEFASQYGFTKNDVKIAESLIDDYLKMHGRVVEVRKENPNDITLINRLTGLKFTQDDAEDFSVSVGPISIEITCSNANASRIYDKSQTPISDLKSAGFASQSKDGIFFLVINKDRSRSSHDQKATLVHEREHHKNKILMPKLYGEEEVRTTVRDRLRGDVFEMLKGQIAEKLLGIEKDYEDELFEKYESATDPREKAFFLEEYMRLKMRGNLNRTKDELIATKKGDGRHARTDYSFFFQPYGPYDYSVYLRKRKGDSVWDEASSDPLWRATYEKIFNVEYRSIVENAIKAFDHLVKHGYTIEETIALLSNKRLLDWPKTARRFAEHTQI